MKGLSCSRGSRLVRCRCCGGLLRRAGSDRFRDGVGRQRWRRRGDVVDVKATAKPNGDATGSIGTTFRVPMAPTGSRARRSTPGSSVRNTFDGAGGKFWIQVVTPNRIGSANNNIEFSC